MNPALHGTPTASPTATPLFPPRTADPPGVSRFADAPCPSMLDGCFHRADADTPTFLRPSAERVTAGTGFVVSFVNRTDTDRSVGPHYWTVWRADDADDVRGTTWTDLYGDGTALDEAAVVPPGYTHDWTVAVGSTDGTGDASETPEVTLDPLPGLYCFGLRGAPLTGGEEPATGMLGALFEVV